MSIENNSELYEKYFDIAKLIEDDTKVNINELNNLMNINLNKMDYSYEVNSDTKTYLYENNKYNIYVGYNEKESKLVSIYLENEEKGSLSLGYDKEPESGIQIK